MSKYARLLFVKFSQVWKKNNYEWHIERDGQVELIGDTDVSGVPWDTLSTELEESKWSMELGHKSEHWWSLCEVPGDINVLLSPRNLLSKSL